MATLFSLVILVIAIILLCKIAALAYGDYITRKKISHIPGLTTLPFIGTLDLLRQTEKGRVDWLLSLMHKFKDGIFLLWMGPQPIIYIYKPDQFKAVLSSTVLIEKSVHYNFYKEWLGTGILLSSGKEWMQFRKLFSPPFHFNMERFGVIISEKTEIMLKSLEKVITENQGKAIDIIPILDHFSMDVVCEIILGINPQDVEFNYIDNIQRLLKLISIRINQPWLWINWIFNLSHVGRKYNETLRNVNEFSKDIIRNKQFTRTVLNDKSQDNDDETAAKTKRKAFLELLLDLNKNKNNLFTTEELRGHINSFVFATYDTTVTTLSWVLFCLGNNLEHQEKVHEELEDIFRDWQGPASPKQLSQLKYLDRVIKESLRLYPTVPLIGRKVTDDINLGGYAIPKDSTIVLAIILLHRDPTIWPDPLKFDPDRFLPENMIHPYAFVPFSAGPRNCLGQRLALLQEKIALTAVLRKWRIKSVETPAGISIYDSTVLRPYQGIIRIHFSPKK
ncbi:PREDICTED: cytochrome P450 4C1-like [Dinoponera quadriceps]|uniref:Cytochrome P450 4C1-like n=1 Tax=Dinoponera quadriceps TaxID=609295 RepID=A0A6P3WST8_DINQU|nr:PREDICTED: cytochrome P450 4C1-like [Dinoponera quadriceps]